MTKFLQVILGWREAFFRDMQMVKMRKYISNTDEDSEDDDKSDNR